MTALRTKRTDNCIEATGSGKTMQNKIGSGLTLDELNDDCLECIFRCVSDLCTQVQIARTCRRFQDVCKRIWQRSNLYKTLCLEEWNYILTQHEDLAYFLNVLREHISSIKIIDQCLNVFLEDLIDLNITCLPNVERFEMDWVDCYPLEKDIEKLSHLVPNLKYLRITAPISGRYIRNFTQLEELYLYDDQSKEFEMQTRSLDEICLHMQHLRVLDMRTYELSTLVPKYISACQNLEVLKLNLNSLKPVLCDVLKLPKLKKLTVLLDQIIEVSQIQNVETYDHKIYETDQFYEIFAKKSEQIVGLAVDNYFMPLNEKWDKDLSFLQSGQLRSFAFCNCEFEATDFLEKCARFSPQLHMLCLRHCVHLLNENVLLFVNLCPQLVHLDVSYCRSLDKALLYDILQALQQQQKQKQRVYPLHIYYLNSSLEYEIEKANPTFWRTQKLVEFDVSFPLQSDIGLSYVQQGFEFDFA